MKDLFTRKKLVPFIGMLAFPLIMFGFFALIVFLQSGNLFLGNKLVFEGFLRQIALMGLLALAVSLQIPNGRFDFSIGSIMILSIIIASNIATDLGLSSFVTLLLFMVCGVVLGAISGLIYVLLKIKAMVTSIGVMMIYEAVSSVIYGGKGFTSIHAADTIYSIANNVWSCLALFLVAFALCYILRKFTKFGYNLRSIRGGQIIAVEAGVNEKRNAIVCYGLAGLLTGVAGMIYGFQMGGMIQPASGMSSIGLMFKGFLAMMIGEFLERWDDISFGIFIGAIVAAMYIAFLTAVGLDNDAITLINAFTLLLFLLLNKYFDNLKVLFHKVFKKPAKAVPTNS